MKFISLFYFLCRLLKDYRREMESHALRWGKLLLPLMAHRAIKIHERALEVVKAEFSAVLIHQRELSQALIPEFKLVTYNCVAMSGLVKTRRNEIRALVHYMYWNALSLKWISLEYLLWKGICSLSQKNFYLHVHCRIPFNIACKIFLVYYTHIELMDCSLMVLIKYN